MFALGGFRIWSLLPRTMRQRIVRKVFPLALDRTRLARPAQPVIVAGFFLSSTSLGALARYLAQSLRHAGLHVFEEDLSRSLHSVDFQHTELAAPDRALWSLPGTVILAATPDQYGYLTGFFPKRALEGKYVIGYFAWELEQTPSSWDEGLKLIDEAWVTSHFVAEALKVGGHHMPCSIVPCLTRPKTLHPHPDRLHWQLSAASFVAFCAFSFRSGIERKNPEAAIRTFQEAFQNGEDVCLVIKASDSGFADAAGQALLALVAQDARILLIQETLSEDEMWRLMASVDVVLSLHRAEGFGLIPAQALQIGISVILTGWSGVLDFANENIAEIIPYTLVPVNDPSGRYNGALSWAEPSVPHAVACLQRLYRDPEARRAKRNDAIGAMEAYVASNQAALNDLVRVRWPRP